MNLRPQNDHEKLIWERFINRNLCSELKEVRTELGIRKSEFDEFKYLCEKSSDIGEKYAALFHKYNSLDGVVKQLRKENKKRRESESELTSKVIQLNLKLESYEKKE